MSNKGKQYELDCVNGLTEATSNEVWVTRPDFSGNSKYAFADVAVVWRDMDGFINGAFIELKKRSPGNGKRASDTFSGSSQGQTGLEELKELRDKTPPWGEPWAGVKFPNRQLIMRRADHLYTKLVWGEGYGRLGPRVTPSDNVSVRKPDVDEAWPSAQSGESDETVILDAIGVNGVLRT